MTSEQRLPKYHETFIPILETLKDGQAIHYNELRKRVRDNYYADLPTELLQLETKSGDQLILNRIGWGKAYLKQAKFVSQPARAMVQITDKGLRTLEGGSLTLSDLKSDPDYLTHVENRKTAPQQQEDETELSPQDMIDSGVQQIEAQVKGDILEKLKETDPYYFERVVLELFQKMGYGDFLETSKSGDGGIDGIINQDALGLEKIYVQAKRYNDNKVREKEIRNFIGAMSGDTLKGIFVTTSSFDGAAITKAQDANHKIILIDGAQLATLMYKYGIGVQISNDYQVKEIDEDYFE